MCQHLSWSLLPANPPVTLEISVIIHFPEEHQGGERQVTLRTWPSATWVPGPACEARPLGHGTLARSPLYSLEKMLLPKPGQEATRGLRETGRDEAATWASVLGGRNEGTTWLSGLSFSDGTWGLAWGSHRIPEPTSSRPCAWQGPRSSWFP